MSSWESRESRPQPHFLARMLPFEFAAQHLESLRPVAARGSSLYQVKHGRLPNEGELEVQLAKQILEKVPEEPLGRPHVYELPDRSDCVTRSLGVDVWLCPCGGIRKVTAIVTSRRGAEEILRSLGRLPPVSPRTVPTRTVAVAPAHPPHQGHPSPSPFCASNRPVRRRYPPKTTPTPQELLLTALTRCVTTQPLTSLALRSSSPFPSPSPCPLPETLRPFRI